MPSDFRAPVLRGHQRMFKLRSGASGTQHPASLTSIDALRRRSQHRMIGAVVLLLVGVVGFPLLFDADPRPLPVDVPIEIPAKNTPPAWAANPAPAASLGHKEEVVAAAPPPARKPAVSEADADRAQAAREAKEKAAREAKEKAAREAKEKAAREAKEKAAREQAAREQAAKDKAAQDAEPPVRIIVQIGAYPDHPSAQEVRWKLERAGLKTYTHIAQTPDGERIRVRLGPFTSRAEAEKAATKAKALGLTNSVLLTL